MLFISVHSCYPQVKYPEFDPYIIEITYQTLKTHYNFITPIEPLVSDKIVAKENITYEKINKEKLKLDIY